MTRSYRPSNGTEGELFMEEFCYRCKRDERFQQTQAAEDGCSIVALSLVLDITDPDYPKEWIQDDDGRNCRCTAFQAVE